jgi:biofilm PGA synthesis N-glycosyltransferase PgaC
MEKLGGFVNFQFAVWVIAALFIVSFIIQLYYYLGIYSKFTWLNDSLMPRSNDMPPVSIVICARNESANLQKHLPRLLSLNYPDYEVVVVNDCSYDDSKEILESFEKQHPNLKVTTLNEDVVYQHDKKFAVTIGIKAAKHEFMVLSDADCYPKSENWLREIVRSYTPATNLVLGFGAYEKESFFVNRLIRFDTFFIGMQYFTAAMRGAPYMGVGRNLSYKKTLFFKNKGFASHSHIRSGDDDLFVNQVANANNTGICFAKDGHTVSIPKDNFGDWFDQKRRHLTTSPHYKPSDKRYIGFQVFSSFFFYVTLFLLMGLQFFPWIILFLFIVRLIVQMIIFKGAMEKLDEKDLWLWSPLLDMVLTFIYPLLTISNSFNEEPRWK